MNQKPIINQAQWWLTTQARHSGRSVEKPTPPTPEQIKIFRGAVQSSYVLTIEEAYEWCAGQVYRSKEEFKSWEAGESDMPIELWELSAFKMDSTLARELWESINVQATDIATDTWARPFTGRWHAPAINLLAVQSYLEFQSTGCAFGSHVTTARLPGNTDDGEEPF